MEEIHIVLKNYVKKLKYIIKLYIILNNINLYRYNYPVNKMAQIIFNTKSDGIEILSEYFRKIEVQELKYYLENNENLPIPIFFQTNVYEPEDVEFKNIFLKHLKIVMKKIFYITTKLNMNRESIHISFISNSIYWNNLFVIKNNIFVSLQYLISIFESIEYNKYTSVENVYINEDEIFDIKLLKNISKCVYSILQNLNLNTWIDFIVSKFNCEIVPLTNIIFKNKYNFLREPNIEYMQNKIIIYWGDYKNIYGTFNSIYSKDKSFSPYWEQKIIKLSYCYINNIYTEIELIDIEKYNTKEKSFIDDIISNPFDYKSTQLTNTIIHN